ncbi:MAG: hydrogenase maturation protease [Fimbriimonadaceae bacterium]|nr:hydrogenase maturation protease [Fimbriimonadaceae bacterium]
MRYLIIGYGNPSREDDGVGHYVVNRLNERFGLPGVDLLGEPRGDGGDTAQVGPHAVRTLWLQQLDVALAEEIAEYDRVWFIDAHVEGPPEIEVEVGDGHHIGVTSHVATPETLVALAGALYGRRPPAVRCSLLGHRFDFAAQLSPPVQAAAEALAARLAAELAGA